MVDVKDKIKELKIKRFENAGYGVYKHSAVEVCHWTKSSITQGPACYKQKFYGIEAHRCIEMSPAFNVCTERCVFCWRPNEFYDKIDFEWEEPEKVINKLVELRRQKLSGFFGNPKALKGKLKDAYEKFPNHWAISLSGEPTLYPYLPELIKTLRNHEGVRSIYLVSNGTEYEMIRKLSSKEAIILHFSIALTIFMYSKLPFIFFSNSLLVKFVSFLDSSKYIFAYILSFSVIKKAFILFTLTNLPSHFTKTLGLSFIDFRIFSSSSVIEVSSMNSFCHSSTELKILSILERAISI